MTKVLIRSHNTILNKQRIFRSTVAKRVTISAAIILTILGGAQIAKILGYQTYGIGLPSLPSLFSREDSEATIEDLQPIVVNESGQGGVSSDPTGTAVGGSAGGSSGGSVPSIPVSGGGSAPTASSPAPSQSTNCSNKAIPAAACTTILSVEANGAKNNPNVQVDTSQLPQGTVFKFDQPSWAGSSGTATINATATFGSYIYNLNITLTESSGWKITQYTQQ